MEGTCLGKPPEDDERHVTGAKCPSKISPTKLKQLPLHVSKCSRDEQSHSAEPSMRINNSELIVTQQKLTSIEKIPPAPTPLLGCWEDQLKSYIEKHLKDNKSTSQPWVGPHALKAIMFSSSILGGLSRWTLHCEPGFPTLVTQFLSHASNQQEIGDLKIPYQLRKNYIR